MLNIKSEIPEWLEKKIDKDINIAFEMTNTGKDHAAAKAVKDFARYGAKKCYELMKSRCFCGSVMLADSEDFEQPLCPNHYEDFVSMKPKPIETAPKDRVILTNIDDTWIETEWKEFSEDNWRRSEGLEGEWEPAVLNSHGCGCCASNDATPTHWMPLPPMPKEGSEG